MKKGSRPGHHTQKGKRMVCPMCERRRICRKVRSFFGYWLCSGCVKDINNPDMPIGAYTL